MVWEREGRFNRSEMDRRLIDKDAVLILDETAHKLIVRNEQRPLEVDFDNIEKVVFDVSTHMVEYGRHRKRNFASPARQQVLVLPRVSRQERDVTLNRWQD